MNIIFASVQREALKKINKNECMGCVGVCVIFVTFAAADKTKGLWSVVAFDFL